jgi:hypothetical protein
MISGGMVRNRIDGPAFSMNPNNDMKSLPFGRTEER